MDRLSDRGVIGDIKELEGEAFCSVALSTGKFGERIPVNIGHGTVAREIEY